MFQNFSPSTTRPAGVFYKELAIFYFTLRELQIVQLKIGSGRPFSPRKERTGCYTQVDSPTTCLSQMANLFRYQKENHRTFRFRTPLLRGPNPGFRWLEVHFLMEHPRGPRSLQIYQTNRFILELTSSHTRH